MQLNRLPKLPLLELIIASSIILIPLANNSGLMFGVQTAKTFNFLYVIAALPLLATLALLLKKGGVQHQISLFDILFLSFVAWLSLNKIVVQDYASFSLKYFELLGLTVLYLVVRLNGKTNWLLILVSICVSGAVQAVYGNLQLWGHYPSHHGMFKMTGSFFNPGPYAGFLCAVLPIALGLYWMHENFRLQISNLTTLCFVDLRFRFQVTNYSEPKAEMKHREVPRIGIGATKSETSNLKPESERSVDEASQSSENRNRHSQTSNLNWSEAKIGVAKSETSNLKSVISNLKPVIIKYLSLITIVAILLVLPAARSRAAWLGAIAGVAYLAWHKYSVGIRLIAFLKGRTMSFFGAKRSPEHREGKHSSALANLGVFLIPALFILVASFSLYHFKKDSADGRMLIWTVTANIIKDNPILGVGQDMFKAHYMDYQSAYFSDNPNSKYEMLAGDNQYAFNEALLTWAENGIIGLLLAGGIVFAVFFAKRDFRFQISDFKLISNLKFSSADFASSIQVSNYSEPAILNLNRNEAQFGEAKSESERSGDEASQSSENRNRHSQISNLESETILKSSILSVLVFGMFAYPSEILPIKIVATLCLALLAGMAVPLLKGEEKPFASFVKKPLIPLCLKLAFTVASVLALFFVLPQVTKLHQAHTTWKDAMDLYSYGLYEQCLTDYEKAYPILKNNGEFLINYGKALSIAEKHPDALKILNRARGYQSNTVLHTALGDSHKALGNYESAEKHYLQAANMTPGKFYALYLLAKLYDASGQQHKAIATANTLLYKEVKVHSVAIEEIREEMKTIINQ